MDNYKYLKVFYNDILVGTLAKTPDRIVAFEYDSDWLNNGFSISPFSLPLIKKVFIPKYDPFGGLFGVFNDSLPDGWGRLLVDRLFLKNMLWETGLPIHWNNFYGNVDTEIIKGERLTAM